MLIRYKTKEIRSGNIEKTSSPCQATNNIQSFIEQRSAVLVECFGRKPDCFSARILFAAI